MSTGDELARQLREAERGEAAAYTRYRFPTWLAPVSALWVGSVTAGLFYLGPDVDHLWVYAHLAVAFGYGLWDSLAGRNAPSSRTPMPGELWWPMVLLVLGAIAVAIAVGLAAVHLGHWAGVLVAVIGTYVAARAYQSLYARAADTARERLA